MNNLFKGSNSKFVVNLFKSLGVACAVVAVDSCYPDKGEEDSKMLVDSVKAELKGRGLVFKDEGAAKRYIRENSKSNVSDIVENLEKGKLCVKVADEKIVFKKDCEFLGKKFSNFEDLRELLDLVRILRKRAGYKNIVVSVEDSFFLSLLFWGINQMRESDVEYIEYVEFKNLGDSKIKMEGIAGKFGLRIEGVGELNFRSKDEFVGVFKVLGSIRGVRDFFDSSLEIKWSDVNPGVVVANGVTVRLLWNEGAVEDLVDTLDFGRKTGLFKWKVDGCVLKKDKGEKTIENGKEANYVMNVEAKSLKLSDKRELAIKFFSLILNCSENDIAWSEGNGSVFVIIKNEEGGCKVCLS